MGKGRILLFILLMHLMISTISYAQDSTRFSINYGFSYDYHNYRGLYETYVKPKFCYTNMLGLQLKSYLFKKSHLATSFEIDFGNKQMNLISDYQTYINYNKYDVQKNYHFKYDYFILGGKLGLSRKFGKYIEPSISAVLNWYILNKQNFALDSLLMRTGTIYSGINYFYKTYYLPPKLVMYGVESGVNFFIASNFCLGIFTSYLYDSTPFQEQDKSIGTVLFNKNSSISIRVSYKIK